jgi:hypothetical protein
MDEAMEGGGERRINQYQSNMLRRRCELMGRQRKIVELQWTVKG